MISSVNVFWITLCFLLLLNLLVSIFLIRRHDLDIVQKVVQVFIVWLIPFAGAIGLWLFNRSQDDDNNKPGGGSFGGGSGHEITGGVQ